MKKNEPKYLKPFEFETGDDEPKKPRQLDPIQRGEFYDRRDEAARADQFWRNVRENRGALNIFVAVVCLQISALIGYCLPTAARNRAEYQIVIEQAQQEAQAWLILP